MVCRCSSIFRGVTRKKGAAWSAWRVMLQMRRGGARECVPLGGYAWEHEAAAVADLAFLWRHIQMSQGGGMVDPAWAPLPAQHAMAAPTCWRRGCLRVSYSCAG